MSVPRQPSHAAVHLDDLLRQRPLPVAEPSVADWKSRLELTLQRVEALSPNPEAHSGTGTIGELDIDDVLRTPLPVEAGEPEPADPFAFEAEQEAIYDELRAPLESGEHAPLRLAQHARPRLDSLHPPAAQRRPLVWLSAAVGTLAAAAAVMLSVNRTSREPSALAVAAPSVGVAAESAVVDAPKLASVASMATALPRPEELPLDRATESAPSPVVALRPAAQPATQSERRAMAAPSPAAKAVRGEEPELVPAAGPSNLADHPSTGEVSAALSHRIQEAQRCLPPTVPSSGARLTFQSNGAVRKVEILNSALLAEPRACLQRALGGVRVAPFARSEFHVNATISRPVGPGAPQSH